MCGRWKEQIFSSDPLNPWSGSTGKSNFDAIALPSSLFSSVGCISLTPSSTTSEGWSLLLSVGSLCKVVHYQCRDICVEMSELWEFDSVAHIVYLIICRGWASRAPLNIRSTYATCDRRLYPSWCDHTLSPTPSLSQDVDIPLMGLLYQFSESSNYVLLFLSGKKKKRWRWRFQQAFSA